MPEILSSDPEIQSPITLEDYLHTSYQPDCDFVDGEVQERLWGEVEHSETQGALAFWFGSHDKEWKTYTFAVTAHSSRANSYSRR